MIKHNLGEIGEDEAREIAKEVIEDRRMKNLLSSFVDDDPDGDIDSTLEEMRQKAASE